MSKNAFDDLTAFDLLDANVFDDVDLPPEDKILFSKELKSLIQEEFAKAVQNIPIGKMISDVVKKSIPPKEKTTDWSKQIAKTKEELISEIKKLKKEEEFFVEKLRDKYDKLKSDFLNQPAYQFGGFPMKDPNIWATGRGAYKITDGTEDTYLVGVKASDTPTNGQVPTFNTNGTITWEDSLTETEANLLYVKLAGDVMVGDLEFPVAGFIMQASDGSRWYVTINSSGALVTTVIAVTTVGSPIGPPPFLWMTYAS